MGTEAKDKAATAKGTEHSGAATEDAEDKRATGIEGGASSLNVLLFKPWSLIELALPDCRLACYQRPFISSNCSLL